MRYNRLHALPNAHWLEKKAMVLDCDHSYAIFTLPHYLLALWGIYNRVMADLLFRCAIEPPRKLLDKRSQGRKNDPHF